MSRELKGKILKVRPLLKGWVVPGFIFLIGIFGSFHAARILLETEVPFVVAQGISMKPAIREGDILIFKGTDPYEIEVGDIIIFKVPEELEDILPQKITHRVIEKKTTEEGVIFRTKGDNAPRDSFEVPEGRVLGKEIAKIPYLGLPILFAKKPLGVVAIVLGFIVISFLSLSSEKNQL
jgi:signal peptidase I